MNTQEQITFDKTGISPELSNFLSKKKLINPTPVQEKCIPLALDGNDIVGIAQTGTGKTLAFGLPCIEKIKQKKGNCLIVLPTRELAEQVYTTLLEIGKIFHIKTVLLIGGVPLFKQRNDLKKNPELIISTPGRLMDHLKQKNCSLSNIKMVVLDEADRMLDIGFMPQIKEILKSVPKERQTMLFSATMSNEISGLANQYMNNPHRIEISPSGTSSKNIIQEAHIVSPHRKIDLLKQVITDSNGSTLIFTRTKIRTKKITLFLRELGLSATDIHSNKSQSQRKQALLGFKSGKYKILVATDVASRGLHIDDISLVINMDMPDNYEDYVHRIGRTGRAGKSGKAISFIEPSENIKLRNIEKLIQKTITILEGSEEFSRSNNSGNRNRSRGRNQSRNNDRNGERDKNRNRNRKNSDNSKYKFSNNSNKKRNSEFTIEKTAFNENPRGKEFVKTEKYKDRTTKSNSKYKFSNNSNKKRSSKFTTEQSTFNEKPKEKEFLKTQKYGNKKHSNNSTRGSRKNNSHRWSNEANRNV